MLHAPREEGPGGAGGAAAAGRAAGLRARAGGSPTPCPASDRWSSPGLPLQALLAFKFDSQCSAQGCVQAGTQRTTSTNEDCAAGGCGAAEGAGRNSSVDSCHRGHPPGTHCEQPLASLLV